MLRLEGQSVAVLIDVPCLAGDAAVEKVPGIELDPWLGRENVQRPPRRRLGDVRRVNQRVPTSIPAVEDEVVVVAAAVSNLRILSLINTCADLHGRPKIERSASNR